MYRKCLNLLHTNSFAQFNDYLTNAVEGKIQKTMPKIKNNLTKQEYARFYPTGSSPGKLCGTAKWLKLKNISSVNISAFGQVFPM